MSPRSDYLPVRLGVLGLGRAAVLMLPHLIAHPRIELLAVADAEEKRAHRVADHLGISWYRGSEGLAGDDEIDAVYIATPQHIHAEHAVTLAEAGKHLLIEKPIAIAMEQCTSIVQAADRAGVTIVVGYSHGASPPALALRELVSSGRYGSLHSLASANFTDYMHRPRRADEWDSSTGGGVFFGQLPHQVDIVRTIHPTGDVLSVSSAAAARWKAHHEAESRYTEGSYSVLLRMSGEVYATLSYSGFGFLDAAEWFGWIDENGRAVRPERRERIKGCAPRSDAAHQRTDETSNLLSAINATGEVSKFAHFGPILASFDDADVMTTSLGLSAVTSEGRELMRYPLLSPEPGGARFETINQLHRAVRRGEEPLHDARWARETLAVCLAALASSRQGIEIRMSEVSSEFLDRARLK